MTASSLTDQIVLKQSYLCVGLDSDITKLPVHLRGKPDGVIRFNKAIIDATLPYCVSYKINTAFYEACGSQGWLELKKTVEYLHRNYPEMVTIADAKRADIGSTNDGYVTAIFDRLGFDAITLHPYLGSEALEPFLSRKDKGCIVLCRTSNPGAGEFQDLIINKGKIRQLVWQYVAKQVSDNWNKNDNCLLVVGATYPQELKLVRQIVGEMDLLIPGVGAQGGELKTVMKVGLNSQKRGMIISSSRSVIFALDPGKEAKKLQAEINQLR